MVGQSHVLKALSSSLDQDRLHHAYLLTGTRGVGKTTIARILASCLNCEKKKKAPHPITIDQRSGFMCEECYNACIWAQKEDQKIQLVGSFQSMQRLNK